MVILFILANYLLKKEAKPPIAHFENFMVQTVSVYVMYYGVVQFCNNML
jgi:hypothetical protein